MKRIGVIDYGIGNLRSVANALRFVGAEPVVSDDAATLSGCDRIIFPGVGAFGYGMQALKARGLDKVVLEAAATEKPLLGICVGMQLLLNSSSEFGEHEGLGIVPGRVDRFERTSGDDRLLRLPNVGWLPLTVKDGLGGLADTLFDGVDETSKFYFVHSYHARADNPLMVATAEYDGLPFAAVVGNGSVVGTQFHPEKSGPAGLDLLKRFVR
jgi:glutamine amidotransferase